MPKIDIWMPWYIAEYQADTAHLNPPQDSAYRKLLEHLWKTRQPLPDDVLALISITKMSPHWVDAPSIPQACLKQALSIGRASASKDDRMLYAWILDLMQKFFYRLEDGSWSHHRVEKDLIKWGGMKEKSTERAVKAAWFRWHGPNSRDPQPWPGTVQAAAKMGDAPSIPQAALKLSPSSSSSPGKKLTTNGVRSSPLPRKVRGAGLGSRSTGSLPAGRKGEKRAKPTPEALQAIAGKAGRGKAADATFSAVYLGATNLQSGLEASKNGHKPGRGVDPRFGPFQAEIFRAYQQLYSAGLVKTTRPSWGTRERSQLGHFLHDNPEVDFALFKETLVRWSAADKTNHAAPPSVWIPTLMEHSVGAVDRYGRPVQPPRRF